MVYSRPCMFGKKITVMLKNKFKAGYEEPQLKLVTISAFILAHTDAILCCHKLL